MPDIEVRSVVAADLPVLIELDHSYHTDYVWQMDIQNGEDQVGVSFREVRLPRSMRVEYPRDYQGLADDWTKPGAFLVAEMDSEVAGYIRLKEDFAPQAIWVTDLVVMRRLRRHGIGSALVLAAHAWAAKQGFRRVILEMQSKNYPAICLSNKLGFEFCGYSDRYYSNQDIVIFFARRTS